ncbi:MAG: hypothetical protein ACI9IL_001041, partial [Rickettsiales bacterium]
MTRTNLLKRCAIDKSWYNIFYVMMSITRELLYIGVNPTEGSNSWEEAFIDIKKRGVDN